MNARLAAHLGTLFLLAMTALPAAAQPEHETPPSEDRYSSFPLPDDLKSAVKNRLKQATGLASIEAFQSTLKQLLDPRIVGPDAVKKFDNFDAFSRAAIDDYFESMINPERAMISEEWIKKIASHMKTGKFDGSAGKLLDRDDLREFAKRIKDDMAVPPPEPAEPIEPSDEFKDWLTNMMDRAEQSRWGEFLQNSPGWQKVLTDMKAPGSPAVSNKSLEGWTNWASKLTWRPEMNMDLKNLRLPNLGRLDFRARLPGLPSWRFSLPQPSMPNFAPPSFTSPSSGLLQTLGWVALIVMALVLLWWMFRAAPNRRTAARASLGPWPVAPRDVSTRQQLVQAFDYLAILNLGKDAQCWNHRRAAEALGGNSDASRQAAQRLAEIYEAARYTEGPDALPEPLREVVRGDLCLLAGLG